MQLIRKLKELHLIHEKMKIQTSTLTKGQSQYKDRINEVRILKVKVIDLKRDHAILFYNAKNINILKRELHNLNRELGQEKTKVCII